MIMEITTELILKDRTINKLGRYVYKYESEDEFLKILDVGMMLNVDEMVDCVIDEFKDDDRADFIALTKDELIQFHHSVGQDIRNAFGLWIAGNPNVKNNADDTSMEVLRGIWDRLQATVGGKGSQPMGFI